MAITDCKRLAREEDAEWNAAASPRRAYRETWQVISDDPEESAAVVVAHPDLPGLLSTTYREDDGAYCVRKRPRRDDRSRLVWFVEVEYRTPSGSGEDGEDPSTNPLEKYEVYWTTESYEEPVTKWYKKSGASFESTRSAIVNSANDPYVPPVMHLASDRICHVLIRTQDPPEWIWTYMDAINSDTFEVDGLVAAPYTLRFQNLHLSWWQREGDVSFREITFELHYRKRTWVQEILDEGWHELVEPTDPESEDYLKKRITDDDGEPMGEITLLNGAGGKLSPPDATPVFNSGLVDDALPFSVLGSL